MQSKGVVISKKDDSVVVKVIREGACSANCAECKTCQNSVVEVEAYCGYDVDVGNVVVISTKTGTVLLTMCLVYLLPIMLPVALYITFSGLGLILSCITSAFGFLFSLLFVFLVSKNKKFISRLKPRVISVF